MKRNTMPLDFDSGNPDHRNSIRNESSLVKVLVNIFFNIYIIIYINYIYIFITVKRYITHKDTFRIKSNHLFTFLATYAEFTFNFI